MSSIHLASLPTVLILFASTAWAQTAPAPKDTLATPSLFTQGSRFRPNWSVTLPDGDWTIDFTVFGRDSFHIIVADAFGSRREEEFQSNEKDVPVRFFRLHWESKEKRMWGWENGHEIYRTLLDDLPSSPGALLRWERVNKTSEESCYCSDVLLKEGAPTDLPRPNAPQPPGLAEKGWKTGVTAPLSPSVTTVLESLTANNESNLTRCYALSALLISQRDPKIEVSPQQLVLIQELVAASLEFQKEGGDSSGAAVLLPVTVASMTATQRIREAARIEAWKAAFFAPFHRLGTRNKFSPNSNLQSGRATVIGRGALLSPAEAIATQDIGRDTLPYFLGADWIWQVLASRPDAALSESTYLVERNENSALAWFLPEIARASPKLFQEIMAFQRRDGKTAQVVNTSFGPVLEEMAAKAAYRLARTQPEDAKYFLSLIKDAETRADVLESLAEKSESFSSDIDQALADAVTQFKPWARDDSPVPILTRRAAYNFKFGKIAAAQGFLTTAMGQVGQLPSTNYRDTWAIYRKLRDFKDPRASLWLNKSKTAAIKRDAAADEFGDGFYISATGFVVEELLNQDKVDEALALARTLNEDNLPTNRALAVGRVASRLARADLNRALKVAEEIEGDQHDSTLVNIAVTHAKINFAAAWKLFETFSDTQKNRSIFRIAPFTPADFSEVVEKRVSLAVQSQLARPQHLQYDVTERDIKGLTNLAPSMLAQLAPSFKADRLLLARDLFLSVGKNTGLDGDPIWERLAITEVRYGYSIPWAPEKLKYVMDSEKSNAEMGLVLKEVS
jgi:hypothetical protein